MKHVVILGGGFAGVSAGIQLRKYQKKFKLKITLIDKNPYHLFTPSLYEVATSEAPQKDVAIPFTKIFEGSFVLVRDTVEKIDTETQQIYLKNTENIKYDYLVISLGSRPAYYNIPGLKEHSTAFKTLKDALSIKNKIKTKCCKEGSCNRKVRAIVGGGGFSGTELAAELLTYKDRIARQNGLAKDCLDITIIQGSKRLLNELDAYVSAIAQKRLTEPYVHFAFGGHIKEVTDEQVITDDGKKYPYDFIIWTGGVEANKVIATCNIPKNKRGQAIVNDFLQVKGYENIFAAGDIAEYIDKKTNLPAPTVAQVAEEQGKIAAKNILSLIKGGKLEPYNYRHFGYVVPIRGHFAVAELMFGIHFWGFAGWLLEQLVFLRYLFNILPAWNAFQRWNTYELELDM